MISFDDFSALASRANVIPLTRRIVADMHTPVSTYLAMREGNSFLFESVEPDEKIGRYSFVGANPILVLRSRDRQTETRSAAGATASNETIFDAAERILSGYRFAEVDGVSGFAGGLVGYIGYPNVSYLEKIPYRPAGIDDEDDAVLGLFPTLVRFDHRDQVITIIHCVLLSEGRPLREQYEAGRQALDALELRLRRGVIAPRKFSCTLEPHEETMGERRYCEAVTSAKRRIVEGDIFQAVLSRRVRMRFAGDPFQVYRALRMINPSPYLFFVDFGRTRLIGSSPEVLLRVRDGVGEVFPIAGTRRRGADPEEDARLEQELLADEKELAEHVMLVDLGRNDLGRVSEFGTVGVPVLKRVERYSHVMHIVSEVRGRIRRELSSLDALKACFPAGTVSGAPKVRAMEIIDELEQSRRGAYAGAVGYIGFNGALDTCIAIRTVVAHGDLLSVQAGAGIVADSVPGNEYQETVSKSRALLEAIRLASAGFTSLPEPGGGRS